MDNNYKYEAFIPAKFTIGLNDQSVGFPSMKDKDGKWSNLTFFQKHSGFKPHVERDASKEITKELTQRVQVVENVPVSGFKLVKLHSWPYKGTDLYKDTECVVLRDPRGWDVQIAIENFSLLLNSNGMNLKNGVLEGVEVMYGWPIRSYGPFSLYVADEHAQKMKDATCKLIAKHENVAYLTPSQFEVGKVYSSKTSIMHIDRCMFMYLGVHAVYSNECQFKALMRKDYSDYEDFVKDKTDVSNPKRHVFYCLNLRKDKSEWSIAHNRVGDSPYFVATTLSKMFETVEDVDITKFTMHNDSTKPVTLQNIKADMEVSAYFNQIDFEKSNTSVAVSYQALEDFYGEMHGYNLRNNAAMLAFPFFLSNIGIFLNGAIRNFTIYTHYDSNGKGGEYQLANAKMAHDYYHEYSRQFKSFAFTERNKEKMQEAFKQLYDYAKPYVTQYVFCNGKNVPEYQNLILNKRTRYRDIK